MQRLGVRSFQRFSTARFFRPYATQKSLQGKVALVTGSTSGIGLNIAHALAAEGAHIMFNGFADAATVKQIEKEISDYGVSVVYNNADLTSPEETRKMVDECVNKLGSVDILCNNAGMQHTSPTDEFPDAQWDKVIALNLSAPFHAVKAALPHMKKKNWGRIINTASVHGLVGSVNKSAYVASKHGLVGFTKVLALETAQTGITANCIGPGWVLTSLVEKQIEANAQRVGITYEQAQVELLKEKTPSRQMVLGKHIGGLAVFLCSDSADQLTGQCIPVDGGWTVQ